MPIAAMGVGLGTALSGAAGAGAMVYGAHKASKASDKSAETQRRADQEAFELERQRDDEERRRWEVEQDFARRQWDAQEMRLEPYRKAGADAIGRLSGLLSPQGQMQWRSPSNVGRGLRSLI